MFATRIVGSRGLAGLLALFTTALAAPANADLPLDAPAQKCASTVLKRSAGVVKTYGKDATKCVKDIVSGKAAQNTVADCVATDPKGKQGKAELKLSDSISKTCSEVPYPMDCPPPCDAADDGGATTAIDDLAELQAGLECVNANANVAAGSEIAALAGAHARIFEGVTMATPSSAALGKCQSTVTKAYDKVFATKHKGFIKCAGDAFKAGATAPPAACIGDDPKGKIAKAIDKLEDKVLACDDAVGAPFDAGACAALEDQVLADCLDAVVECAYCRWANVVIGSDVDCDLFDDSAANGSCVDPISTTTTTTLCTTTTTSTTLAAQDPLCPDVAVVTARARITNDACVSNSDCTVGTCDTASGSCFTQTEVDLGSTGLVHDLDISDGAQVHLGIRCGSGGSSGACGACPVTGLDPTPGNCRCIDDNRAICDEPYANDADDCGGSQCVCYEEPPVPVSRNALPVCSVSRYAAAPTGFIDVDSGDISVSAKLRVGLYLGESTPGPCPQCGGTCTAPAATLGDPCVVDAECDDVGGDGVCGNLDSAANDGIREGTCVGGQNDGASCDVNVVNRTLAHPGGADGYSYDCFPSVGANLSGPGLRVDRTSLTGVHSPVPAALECLSGLDTCHCGSCSLDSSRACSSNTDCAPCYGVCENGTSQSRNLCTGGGCSDIGGGEGECTTGPDDRYCDGFVRLDGHGILPCTNNSDCTPAGSGIDAGECTLIQRRECFLDPVTAGGTAHATAPIVASLTCVPQTGNPIANSGLGLPGLRRDATQLELTTLCTNDHGTPYDPGAGNCP